MLFFEKKSVFNDLSQLIESNVLPGFGSNDFYHDVSGIASLSANSCNLVFSEEEMSTKSKHKMRHRGEEELRNTFWIVRLHHGPRKHLKS